jgi:hypothetical protein
MSSRGKLRSTLRELLEEPEAEQYRKQKSIGGGPGQKQYGQVNIRLPVIEDSSKSK